MGIHADDAVWDSIEHELFLDDHRDFIYDDGWGREPHPMFDSGCQDLESLNTELGWLQQHLTLLSRSHLTMLRSHNPEFCKKYRKTWEMRLGMAKQVFNGIPLSIKQKNWIDTN